MSELERNWLIQAGILTPTQADALLPCDVMRAYRAGAAGLERANAQAEKFERFHYLTLNDLERLLNAADGVDSYAWSAVTVDCEEGRAYLQELLDALRREVRRLRTPKGPQEHLIGITDASRAEEPSDGTSEKPTQSSDGAPAIPVVPPKERAILAAIEAALASGHSPADVLDENSPIRDAIREVLK